jgi:hypothetical protein
MRRTETIFFGHQVRGQIWACKAWKLKVLSTTWRFKCVFCQFSVFGRCYTAVAVSEAFLQPAAENGYPEKPFFLATSAESTCDVYRQTTMTIGLEPQHKALNVFSVRFGLARTDFKSWGAKNNLTAAGKLNFPPFSTQERLRNGWGTAEERSSARLALLL